MPPTVTHTKGDIPVQLAADGYVYGDVPVRSRLAVTHKNVLKLVTVRWQQLTGTHTKGVVKYNYSIGAYGYTCEIKCDGFDGG